VGAAFPDMQKMASQKKKKLKAAAERSSAAGKTAFCGHAS